MTEAHNSGIDTRNHSHEVLTSNDDQDAGVMAKPSGRTGDEVARYFLRTSLHLATAGTDVKLLMRLAEVDKIEQALLCYVSMDQVAAVRCSATHSITVRHRRFAKHATV